MRFIRGLNLITNHVLTLKLFSAITISQQKDSYSNYESRTTNLISVSNQKDSSVRIKPFRKTSVKKLMYVKPPLYIKQSSFLIIKCFQNPKHKTSLTITNLSKIIMGAFTEDKIPGQANDWPGITLGNNWLSTCTIACICITIPVILMFIVQTANQAKNIPQGPEFHLDSATLSNSTSLAPS